MTGQNKCHDLIKVNIRLDNKRLSSCGTEVTPDLHLTYSKHGVNLGLESIYKIFLHKIICCGCVLESPHRGDSNTHPKHMILLNT